MDKTQAAPFRQQLLAQQAELLAQLVAQRGGVIGRAEAAADHFGQPEDPRAQLATERELAFALDAHETIHLAAIEAALARIETGKYGECTDCGAHIAAARLHATPEAARCVHCQEKAEQHRRAA
ncbi:MAG: TraR/DksA family transcriptional regulator [Acidovorax sp.]|jgi:DnaK suppressor protein|uniref:TraR/DksA family transcriptional regulator n=1 Tax=Acidovorax sp. TaxID=1872122 RepID=UPI0026233F97|nr:TraR/DksA family transcriptional regulator [Acidovorax sp.]MDH4416975.1 TraR/DksA family transcriptional regulator [Acidovorax sp.]